MIEMLIVDDHTIFRAGLTRLVSDEADIRVVGEVADGASALTAIRRRHYDVVVLDINMAGRNGLDTLTTIRAEQPELPIVMLSMYAAEQYAMLALRAGANAYLSKDAEPQEFLDAIRVAAGGERYLPSKAASRVLMQLAQPSKRLPHETLTPREAQIMMLIVKGQSLTDIGGQICVSVKTVSSHRARLLSKLGLTSNAQLVQYAMRNRLVD